MKNNGCFIKEGTNRNYILDFIRITACMMVVMLHIAASGWGEFPPTSVEWRYYNLADMMVRGGVPLFFMISGALFFHREEFNIKKFILHNEMRLIGIFMIWSFLYAWNHQFVWRSYTNMHDFIVAVINGHYHLWFLRAMIVVYVFVPVVHACIQAKKLNMKYLLILFAISIARENILIIPNISNIFLALMNIWNDTWMQYLGYMLLGYWMSNQKFGRKTRIASVVVYAVVTMAAAYGNRWYSVVINKGTAAEWTYGYFTLPVLIQSICIFCFFQSFQQVNIKYPNRLVEISACTFGIYLIHPYVLDILSRLCIKVSDFSPIMSIPLVFILVFGISFAIILLLRKVPIIRRIVS